MAKNTDFEVRSMDTMCVNESELKHPFWHNLKYLVAGILFGIILVKAEVISWFRIQEMFRLQSFHMYGVIGSAIAVGDINNDSTSLRFKWSSIRTIIFNI